ncbi:TPA: uroporphyrinogen-III synthase [Streptococcus suis]|nr:uroporphyrinogen-III synthase [Streptococcus suis]HEM6372142.1 uroporphyrinogen-III synthase [Streptococcus suis]
MIATIVITRDGAIDLDLHAALENAGFQLATIPLIAFQAHPLPQQVQQELEKADWLFCTSATAFDCFLPYLPSSIQIASIGEQTSRSIREAGRSVAFESTSQYGKDFVAEWLALGLERQKILLPQSHLANPLIAERLRQEGHSVLAWEMYDTVAHKAGQAQLATYLELDRVLWTFASPSAWHSFTEVVQKLPVSHKIAVIGKTTAQAVMESGYEVDLMPDKPSITAILETIMDKEKRYGIF